MTFEFIGRIRQMSNLFAMPPNQFKGANKSQQLGPKLRILELTYFTAPAVRPFTINLSKKIPMIIKGKIAADDTAAMLHQLMP